MKNVIGALVAVVGLAGVVNAQTTKITAQVWDGAGWSSSVQKNPLAPGGAEVRVRYVVSYTGTASPFAFAGGNFQPLVGRWDAADAVALGARSGNFNAPAADDDFSTGEEFGRTRTTAYSNISSTNQLTAHQNNIGGVNTLRIAQATVTNAPGAGATLNNVNGSGGIPLTQNVTGPGRPADAPAIAEGKSIVVYGVKITLKADNSNRNLDDVTKDLSISGTAFSTGGTFRWFAANSEISGSISSAAADLAFESAFIDIVPTPASLALVGVGGLVATRRRR
jgi:hypothetical protein